MPQLIERRDRSERQDRDPRTVVLLHGILLNRWALWPLERFLRSRGHRTLNLSYPSTRHSIEELTHQIAGRIADDRSENPIDRIDLVTHSMGGLIARRLLTHEDLPAPGRLVQIVPPNRGSEVARRWRGRRLYRALYGTSAGWQLGEGPEEIDRICGIPEEIEWGIVMGEAAVPIRPWLPTPNDWVVSHAEMMIGSRPAIRIEGTHTALLWFHEAWQQVAAFIETGRFHLREEFAD